MKTYGGAQIVVREGVAVRASPLEPGERGEDIGGPGGVVVDAATGTRRRRTRAVMIWYVSDHYLMELLIETHPRT